MSIESDRESRRIEDVVSRSVGSKSLGETDVFRRSEKRYDARYSTV